MNRFRAWVILGVASLAWAACGSSGGGAGTTLTLATVRSEAIEQLAREYRKVEPNVHIVISTSPIDSYQTVMRTRLASGNAPDLFLVWPGSGNSMAVHEIAGLDTLADLSATPWARPLPAMTRSLLGAGGKVYVWSPGTDVIGAVYNKAVFAHAGASVPRTWDELLALCDRFKRAGLSAIAVGNQTPWVAQLIDYAIAPSAAYGPDPSLANDMLAGRASFARSGWRETLTRYVELSRRGCFQPDPNGTPVERQVSLVARGQAAMAVLPAPAMQSVRADNPTGSFGMFPLPAADRSQDLWIPAGLAAGFA